MSDTNDWNDWEHRELHKELAELKVENAMRREREQRELAELRKDKERLDWLLEYEGNYWLLDSRADIDWAMKGESHEQHNERTQ